MSDSTHPSIVPVIRYQDADAAIGWLKQAFGFEEKEIDRGDDGALQHAELRLGTAIVMPAQVRENDWMGGKTPDALSSPMSIYLVLADIDPHHDRAKAAGAEIVYPLTDQDYGSRDYSARDLEGNLWSFGTYDPYAPA